MKNMISVLLRPHFWFRNDPIDWSWDKLLNSVLDRTDPVYDGEYLCRVGAWKVWIANYPYQFGDLHHDPAGIQQCSGLPSRRTAIRLKRAVNRMLAERANGGDK